jgi:XTP/dITP diphosphohydrolase
VSGSADITVVRGSWRGVIAREPLGQAGFGYDPIFIPQGEIPGDGRSAAQLSPAEKDAASHRGRALGLLVPALWALAGR